MRAIVDKKILLLVDDEPSYIGLTKLILEDDYKIRIATSGAQALSLAQSVPTPALILLDVQMPDMDGYDVCRKLKASPQTCDIPVIFLTGQTRDGDETKGFESGAADYIHKPFSPAVMKARVRTHITLHEAHELQSRQLLAINNELEVAREIQLCILPSDTPKIAGLDIAARYLPMSAVAGDFYDFISVDERHLGVLIADVSGHGLPAALIASLLKGALAAQAPHAVNPARVLAGLNQSLCGIFRRHYVTAAYLFVDLENDTVSYAGAGHPPLLMWSHREGRAHAFEENGLFLGPFADAAYSSIQLPLEAGDRLFLYTDGILEFRSSAGEEFGADRLRQFIDANHGLGAVLFVEALISQLWHWAGHVSDRVQLDDITLLVIDILKR
jgi:phosphoserine phosphatase RsbU/P